jgi:hypothetical protein
MIGNFPAILNFNRLFLKLNSFICNYLPVLPDHRVQMNGNRFATGQETLRKPVEVVKGRVLAR